MERPRIRVATVPAALGLSAVLTFSLFTFSLFDPPRLAAQETDAGETDAGQTAASSEPGEPPATVVDKIVVTARRQEVPADEVGVSVTVITAEEIEARRVNTVAELLRTVPGIEVVASGGSGQVTSVFLRGGSSSQTLVLVDDVRVNSTTTGAFDFADLSTDLVERIEIVRGPLSTLYGSEAVAGVVSITTRRGDPGFHARAAAEAGSENHRRFQVSLDGATPRFDYSVSYSDLETDAISAAARAPETDPHSNTTFAGRLGFGFAGDGRVDVTLRAFASDLAIDGIDFVLGPVDDPDRFHERDGTTGGVHLTKNLGRVRQSFLVGFHDDELRGTDPGDPFSNFTIDSRTAEVTAQSDVTLTDDDVLIAGVSYEERRGESVGNFDESLSIGSFFVQNAWSWKSRFFLTAGARYDEHSEFGSATTYRLAGAWKLGAATRLHSSFGTGFKAPTLVDLFFPFFGNPGLEPERSSSADAGVERRFLGGAATLDVTYFATTFDDLIVFDFVTSLPQNVGEAESRGVETTFDYRPGPRFRLAASYTWNETEDLATGRQLPRRPEHRAFLSLFLRPVERLRASVTAIAVADRIDSDGTAMDDYERVDLTLQYRFGKRFEPYLRLENVFDERYEEVNGFGSPGASAVVGLAVRN